MNFLAHLLLSGKQEQLLIGNFLADYMRKAELEALPEDFQEGIALHREIDSFTDTHPEVIKGVRRLYPYHRKYASVVLDVFYDYFLSTNWSKFSTESKSAFSNRVYHTLEKYVHIMPPSVQRRLPGMIGNDWLQSYGQKDGIAYTFSRVQQRTSRPEFLDHVMKSLDLFEEEMNEEFLRFFPDVITQTSTFRQVET